MKINWVLSGVALVVAASSLWMTVSTPRAVKIGYIINKSVFDGFTGKKVLEDRLQSVSEHQQHIIDSLSQVLAAHYSEAGAQQFQEVKMQFAAEYEQLSGKYSEDIWKQINQWVSDYAKEKNYDFIYGATGDGTVMYGNEAFDLSVEITEYINKKYEGVE